MSPEISNCILFKGLSELQIEYLTENLAYTVKEYGKNEIIAFSNNECRNVLIVSSGSVRGEMVDLSGKTIKIEDIEKAGMLAPAFIFGNNNRYPVNIVANENCSIVSISKDNFLELMQGNKKILTNYLDSISNRAQFLSGKLKFLSFQTIKGKIAHFLLTLEQKTKNQSFTLPKSQNELSELFGVARPSLARAMRELNDEGIIVAEGKNIEILDKTALISLMKN